MWMRPGGPPYTHKYSQWHVIYTDLELEVVVEEQVLQLDVAVKDVPLVAVLFFWVGLCGS